jgi:glycosyltransferase involved in cell wall biosynthesis
MNNSNRLLGLQPKEKVAMLLAEADCFALTSDHETFGVVCIEAFASGLPVVSTRCGGTDEIVTTDNGLFAEAGSAQSVATALVTMGGRIGSGFYESQRIREGCVERFSQQSICSRLVKIYEEVLI